MHKLLDKIHGDFLPQAFASVYGEEWHVPADQREILWKGPLCPGYWTTWRDVLPSRRKVIGGVLFRLAVYDGNLYATRV